ncbi:hypothetical protein JCM33374_g1907 [Metschnikowia sp. JCM 33374]|nr:hypothetical protein JCM33374_g1907 [Metschnikowia sp. JCM 33374]
MSYLPIGKDDGNHNVVGNPDMELREQDRWLPIANVARLMKGTLPMTAKVSKDAKECMQECVSEFISFITSEASDKCLREKRKTINGEDVLFSLHDLGFENYAEVLKIYLAKYREQQALKQERGETRSSKKPYKKKKASSEEEEQDQVGSVEAHDSLGSHENPELADSDPHSHTDTHTLAYGESAAENDIKSPDYFQHYDPEDGPHGEAVGIKHDIDLHREIAMDEKGPVATYQYGDFMHDQGDGLSKTDHGTDSGRDKNGGIDTLSKLADADSDMENMGSMGSMDNGISSRAYY